VIDDRSPAGIAAYSMCLEAFPARGVRVVSIPLRPLCEHARSTIGGRVLLVHAERAEAGDGLADGLAHPAGPRRESRTDERNGEQAYRNP
jgi:hypothetical protein